MPLKIPCPNGNCQALLTIADNAIGKKVRCPKCTLVFPVKPPPQPDSPVILPPDDDPSPPLGTCVFISHAVADKDFVDSKVNGFFKRHNVDTWICHEIPGGAPWKKNIMEGLNKSSWFVLVLSPQSVTSDAVRVEVELAFETKPGGRILPILMEPIDQSALEALHPELPDIQYIDFTKNVEFSQRRLLVSMVHRLNNERNELQKVTDQQSRTIEDLKISNADYSSRERELASRVRRAATFDGQWSEGGGGGTVPAFCPMKTRGVPIIAVCNLKGGVGKTTLTANLGATLWGASFRKRILLVDLDYQGSLSTICLDATVRSKLTQSQRFVQELFKQTQHDPKLLINLTHEVLDERSRNHQGSIIAANEDLARTEGEVLGRWMMKDDGVDGRYLLRQVLHSEAVQRNFDIVLMDCPPRMTAAGINAFLAADFVLIPTPLEEVSTEAVPRLLQWVRERRDKLLSTLDVLGVVVSRTRWSNGALVEHEKELLIRLKEECKDYWGSPVKIFKTCIPAFPADANNHRYPAQHSKMRAFFDSLIKEILPALAINPAAPARLSAPVKARK